MTVLSASKINEKPFLVLYWSDKGVGDNKRGLHEKILNGSFL